jgi:hypothetical protein
MWAFSDSVVMSHMPCSRKTLWASSDEVVMSHMHALAERLCGRPVIKRLSCHKYMQLLDFVVFSDEVGMPQMHIKDIVSAKMIKAAVTVS